jgi:hypothetical protein
VLDKNYPDSFFLRCIVEHFVFFSYYVKWDNMSIIIIVFVLNYALLLWINIKSGIVWGFFCVAFIEDVYNVLKEIWMDLSSTS